MLRALCAPDVVRVMEQISGIAGLSADPYLHGGGMHMCGGRPRQAGWSADAVMRALSMSYEQAL